MEKPRYFHKNTYFCVIENLWLCGSQQTVKILKEMGIPDHLTCLLRNLCVGQEATVRTGHGTMEWFKIGKGVWQGCILSHRLFNLYAKYVLWNARLDEPQAGIKIARRNINNLRYADDSILMAESEDELKNLLRRVKEESEISWLEIQHWKTKVMRERERVGWFGRMALKPVYYYVRNESPVYVWCRIQDAWGWCTGMIQRDDPPPHGEGGSCLGTHVHPWWIHVNVWQNQYSIVK